jgi:hypothetical protein
LGAKLIVSEGNFSCSGKTRLFRVGLSFVMRRHYRSPRHLPFWHPSYRHIGITFRRYGKDSAAHFANASIFMNGACIKTATLDSPSPEENHNISQDGSPPIAQA